MLSSLLLRLAYIAESLEFSIPAKLLNRRPSIAEKREFVERRMKFYRVSKGKTKSLNRRGVRHK